MVPRKFYAFVLVGVCPLRTEAFFILLPVQRVRIVPHRTKTFFVKVERENKMSKITRRNFLKVSGVAAAAAALTACGGSSSTASSAASGAASSEAVSTAAKLDKIKVAVPNDTTNEARALQLLAAQGLITVRDGAGLTATVNDITENPHNLQIKEIEAAQLPRTVQDVDFAVINGNYAMEAGFSVGKDALATEDASSEAAQTYANVLVVKEGRENDPAIQALYAALTGDKVKDYINSTYDGAVVPIF